METIDGIAVITQICKEPKLWIHPNLRRPSFSFTYSFKFTCFCTVHIQTLKKNKKPLKKSLKLQQNIKNYIAERF